MNQRERYLSALLFKNPDKVPLLFGGPRESTLKAWHEQGLPRDRDWHDCLCESIGVAYEYPRVRVHPGVNFVMIPEFEKKIVERRANSIVVQDWKGNICEISDQYDASYLGGSGGKIDFVTRRWLKCPVENRDDWEQMKPRYDAGDPARFPADFDARAANMKDRDSITQIGFSGPFWQLREWMGFEGLCMAFIEQPDLVRDMVFFWQEFVAAILSKMFARGMVPDSVNISEDMAYKEKAMISPAMCEEFLVPCWKRWAEILRKAGVPIFDVDSDGYVGELIPLWIESGFQVNDPQEVAAGNDLPEYRRRYGARMAYMGGVDKRAMARGGDVLRAEIKRLAPVVEAGGYIPSCDHGIPPDVSWPNMIEYGRLLARVTGWL